MVCKQCQELLSEYIDGALELGEQVNIERHLGDCEPCRAVRDDLLQIVHFSQQLPTQSPSTALWPRISSDLAELQPSFWFRPLRWLVSFRTLNFNFSVPQLIAGAAALAVVVSIGFIVSRHDNGPVGPSLSAGLAAAPQVTPLTLGGKGDPMKTMTSRAIETRKVIKISLAVISTTTLIGLTSATAMSDGCVAMHFSLQPRTA